METAIHVVFSLMLFHEFYPLIYLLHPNILNTNPIIMFPLFSFFGRNIKGREGGRERERLFEFCRNWESINHPDPGKKSTSALQS